MIPRQKRLHEVFEHLRNFFGIHTQIDFAVALKYSRVYISSALNGNEKNLTDKLFESICEAYPGVFDLKYLLNGEGSLLTVEEEVHNEDYEKLYNPQSIDQSSLVNAALAAKDEVIAAKNEVIAALRNELKVKDELIDTLRQHIIIQQSVSHEDDPLKDYPFEIGMAESGEKTKSRV